MTTPTQLDAALAQIDRAFERMAAERARDNAAMTPEQRASHKRALNAMRATPTPCNNGIFTGRPARVSDVEYDYYTGQAGAGYFA